MKKLILALAFVFAFNFAFDSIAEAAVAHVQTIQTLNINTDTTMATGSMTTTAGNTLVIGWITFATSATAAELTSAKLGGTTDFTVAKTIEANTSGTLHLRASLWILENAAGGAHTVTLAYPSSGIKTVFFMEFSGGLTASSADGTGASASGATNTPASGTVTTTNSDDFWIGLLNADSTSFTAGSGWTIPTNGSVVDPTKITSVIEYKANPGATTGNANLGATTTGADWVALGFAFKATGGGGGATSPTTRHSLTGVGK